MPPLGLRIPMSDASSAGVRAVQKGAAVTVEGQDYRGVDVIAHAEPIDGTDWVVESKVDRDEILAETRYRGATIFGFALLGILLGALVIVARYQARQRRLYHDLYETQQSQRREEEQFRTTLYSIGDAVVTTDNEGCVQRMNPVAEQLTGWPESEARGRPLEDVFRIFDEDDREPVESPAQRVLREGRAVGLAYHTLLVARDGTERSISDSCAPIRGADGEVRGVVLVFSNQTEQRQQERELRGALEALGTSRDLMRSVVDATRDLLAAIDADFRYIAFNAGYEEEVRRLYGVSLRLGDSMMDVLATYPDDLASARANFLRALWGEQFLAVLEFGDATVDRKSYELAFGPIRNSEGVIIGAVHASRDVTKRVRAEHALAASESRLRAVNDELERIVEKRTRELIEARDAAETSNRVKDIFLATMSHELRTPLNSIIGFSDVLLSGIVGELNEEQRTQLSIVNRSGHQLLGLISDVLDISKIETGQLTLHLAPLALNELLHEQQRVFELQARQRGLALRFEVPDEPVLVLADAQRLRQVIGNLLSNALKFTDDGEVGLSTQPGDAFVRITVFDSGIGIAATDQPKLFKAFQRLAPPRGGARDGTGLGLAISRRLVEAMGGQIGVESEPGRGSRFWFTVPRAPSPAVVTHDRANERRSVATLSRAGG
jgi:PAS domain S-box-containing protein